MDPSQVIDRLERIEKETKERLNQENIAGGSRSAEGISAPNATLASCAMTIVSDFDLWRETQPVSDVESLYNDISVIRPITNRLMRNAESPQE